MSCLNNDRRTIETKFNKTCLIFKQYNNIIKIIIFTFNLMNRSRAWDAVSEADKRRLGFEDRDNGEWWMTYGDFVGNYDDATLCTMGPDFDEDGEVCGDRLVTSQCS